MKKIIALILVVISVTLSGCSRDIKISTGLNKDEIFRIGDETADLGEIMLLLVNEKNQYESGLGDDIWTKEFDDINLETEVKNKVKNEAVELYVMYMMAKEEKITLNEDEKTLLHEAAKTYYESLTEEEINGLEITEDTVYRLYEKMYLSDKYYELKTSQSQKEISDEEAKVIEVMYIFFKTGDVDIHGTLIPYEEEKIAEIRSKALSVLENVKQGGDFQSLAIANTDADEFRCIFGRETMEEAFETAAFTLKDGEVSDLVETEKGYYIIKCINDYLSEETQENKINMEERCKADKFKEIYEPYLEKQSLEFHTKLWEQISISDYVDYDSDSIFEVYQTYCKG